MKNFIRGYRRRGILDYAVIFLGLALLFWAGCNLDQVPGPEIDQQDQEFVLSRDNVQVQVVMAVQERATDDLLSKPGIVGVGTGMTEDGRPAIVVMVVSEEASKAAALPAEIEAVPVVVLVTGEIKAWKGPPGGGNGGDDVDHTVRFDRPVPLGISTGHPDITAGTLGARLTDGTNVYALSNNHVYADINTADLGDDVIQPGTFDGGALPDDFIGDLAAFVTIDFSAGATNVVDAAIASTTTGDVGNATTSDCYGIPSLTTATASVNMKVQKCGRTTELTKGKVSAINATVNVNYGDPGVATFVNQIVVSKGAPFSAGGDSGSLVVVNDANASPVGLLFAGSNSTTIINPINAVLSELAVVLGVGSLTIDGN